MEQKLNQQSYQVNYGNVIYDNSYPVNVKIISMESPAAVLKKGTILSVADDSSYFILGDKSKTGEASVIVQETLDCTNETGSVDIPVYITGKVDKNYLVATDDYSITEKDIEALRKNGLIVAESIK